MSLGISFKRKLKFLLVSAACTINRIKLQNLSPRFAEYQPILLLNNAKIKKVNPQNIEVRIAHLAPAKSLTLFSLRILLISVETRIIPDIAKTIPIIFNKKTSSFRKIKLSMVIMIDQVDDMGITTEIVPSLNPLVSDVYEQSDKTPNILSKKKSLPNVSSSFKKGNNRRVGKKVRV